MPAISTRRDLRSMTKSTKYRINPRAVSTSTVKKSVAAIAPLWAFRKVLQGERLSLAGAGSIPACSSSSSARIVAQGASSPIKHSQIRYHFEPGADVRRQATPGVLLEGAFLVRERFACCSECVSCMIDNTHVVLRGTGREMVPVAENVSRPHWGGVVERHFRGSLTRKREKRTLEPLEWVPEVYRLHQRLDQLKDQRAETPAVDRLGESHKKLLTRNPGGDPAHRQGVVTRS